MTYEAVAARVAAEEQPATRKHYVVTIDPTNDTPIPAFSRADVETDPTDPETIEVWGPESIEQELDRAPAVIKYEEALIDTPTWDDIIYGMAHVIADGNCLRANIPAMYSEDPDAYGGIVVTVFPAPGLPDHWEVFRLDSTDAIALRDAIRDRYISVSVKWDEA